MRDGEGGAIDDSENDRRGGNECAPRGNFQLLEVQVAPLPYRISRFFIISLTRVSLTHHAPPFHHSLITLCYPVDFDALGPHRQTAKMATVKPSVVDFGVSGSRSSRRFDRDDDTPAFRLNQFWQQFFAQLLFPFSIPFALLFCGTGYTLNMLGMPKPFAWPRFFTTTFFQVCSMMPPLCIIFWALSSHTDNSVLAATLRADLLHVLVAFFSQRLAVAIKYAYLLPAVYKQRLSVWADSSERSTEQIIAGWQYLKLPTLRKEMAVAAKLGLLDVQSLRFSLRSRNLMRIHAELDCADASTVINEAMAAAGLSVKGGDEEDVFVPVIALTEAIVLAAGKESTAYAKTAAYLNFVGGLISTFTTAVLRAAFGAPPLGTDAYQAFVIVTHWLANVLVLGVVLIFLNVGAVDHFRRARSHALLGSIFSQQRGDDPLIEMGEFENARAFLAARGLLCNFGEVYHERLVLVTASSLLTFVAVAFYIVIVMYVAPMGSSLGVLLSPFILLHVLVAPAFACILAGLMQAARANSEMKKHAAVVVEASVRARLRQLGGSPHAVKQPCFALLKDIHRLLRAGEDEAAIKILGFEVTGAIAKSFVGAWISLETACAYQFLIKAL